MDVTQHQSPQQHQGQHDPNPDYQLGYYWDTPYAYQHSGEKYRDIILGVTWGIIIALVICMVWWYWAYAVYRWSDERLSGIIAKKYTLAHSEELDPETEFFYANNIRLSSDRSIVLASMEKRVKETHEVLSSVEQRYQISTSAASCTLLDLDCIAV